MQLFILKMDPSNSSSKGGGGSKADISQGGDFETKYPPAMVCSLISQLMLSMH